MQAVLVARRASTGRPYECGHSRCAPIKSDVYWTPMRAGGTPAVQRRVCAHARGPERASNGVVTGIGTRLGQSLESGFDLAADGWRANPLPVQNELAAVESGVVDAALAAGDPERELEGAAAQGDACAFAGDLANWLRRRRPRYVLIIVGAVGHGLVPLSFSPASVVRHPVVLLSILEHIFYLEQWLKRGNRRGCEKW